MRIVDAEGVEDVPTDAISALRVVTYNIAHGRGRGQSNWTGASKRRQRLRDIAAYLQEADADVVILNEVDFSSVWSGHENQAKLIAEAAGYRYRVEQRNIDVSLPFVSLSFGNAILSRFPIREADIVELPGYAKWETFLGGKKQAVVCIIECDDGLRLRVIAAHLDTRGPERLRVESALMIVRVLAGSDIPTVLAGDLNSTLPDLPWALKDDAGRTAVSVLRDEGGLAIKPADWDGNFASTFPSDAPNRTIDWILAEPVFEILSLNVPDSDLSDHLPVVAEVRW